MIVQFGSVAAVVAPVLGIVTVLCANTAAAVETKRQKLTAFIVILTWIFLNQ
jgi:hypothetical protein